MAKVAHILMKFKRRNHILWFNGHALRANYGIPWEATITLGSQGTRTIGSSNGVSESILQQCIARMQNLCKLLDSIIRTECFPYELLHRFSAFVRAQRCSEPSNARAFGNHVWVGISYHVCRGPWPFVIGGRTQTWRCQGQYDFCKM